ncbi:internal scaffolding protein [Microviridae sp.]|nr:internal scaffolding protein [Microviridae sp.]
MNPTRNGSTTHRSVASPIERIQTSFIGVDSLTRQDQAESCNINNIYRKTQQGQLSLVASTPPTFGDFSDVGSYDTILESISAAKEAFMDLPSEVRKEYNNDPSVYYEKVTSEAASNAKAKAQAIDAQEKAQAYQKRIAEAKSLLGLQNESD